jgi:hypothetical protein
MRVKFALSGALLLLLGSYAIAHEITATILGTVTDASGAVVSGATNNVVNTDQAIVVRRLTTSNNGEYVVPLLPIGHYDVSAEAPGFKTSLETGIELNVNDRRAVNFILQIHGRSDEIKVEAEPLQVDLQSATAAGLVSGIEVRELAINTRNYSQLVVLQPGVSSGLASDQPYVGVSGLNGGVNSVSFSINGARQSQNNWTLDGADNVDRGSNIHYCASTQRKHSARLRLRENWVPSVSSANLPLPDWGRFARHSRVIQSRILQSESNTFHMPTNRY